MDSWERILSAIESRLDPQSFDTWFRPTSLSSADGGTLVVSVPNEVFRDWLTQKYSDLIREVAGSVLEGGTTVHFQVEGEEDLSGTVSLRSEPREAEAGAGASEATVTATIDTAGQDASSSEGAPPMARGTSRESDSPGASTSLNPKYTFETFVVGNSNQFAHAAARAVAEAPSRSYNPLFIYGGVGLGKTHIMLAIGHHVRQQWPNLRVVYLSSERFMNELINSIRYDRTHEFRERYRNIDVLLMDDIQFLAGKERTQEEFFHTFNALHEEQRQIVVTSDAPPKEIPTLEERLQSRFEWGLLADIQPPDLETKVAILKKKAAAEAPDQHLPDDVLMYIATGSKSNIRELEGALIRLLAYASLTGETVDLDLAKRVLKDTLKSGEKAVTIESIQQRVSEFYGLSQSELNSRSNARRITGPRQVAMYLCKELTQHSLPEIGRAFGGKHHSTVIHSVKKIEKERKRDDEIDSAVSNLLETFQ